MNIQKSARPTTSRVLAALTAGLLTVSAVPSFAATQSQPNRNPPQQTQQQTPNRGNPAPAQNGSGQNHAGQNQGGQNQGGQNHTNQNQGRPNAAQNSDAAHGRWNTSWGARPPAPPAHFTRTSDWNRHVRACQQRYRSYDARTDHYVPRAGQTAICRL